MIISHAPEKYTKKDCVQYGKKLLYSQCNCYYTRAYSIIIHRKILPCTRSLQLFEYLNYTFVTSISIVELSP